MLITSEEDPPPEMANSPFYWLAVLYSARRSGDKALERLARRKLNELGVCVAFGDELPPPPKPHKRRGADRG